MEKINVAELLRNCPSGMELDCTMFDGVYFDHVDESRHNKIKCYVNNGNERFEIVFNEYGQYISNNSAKCVIFPKGKTTWEGFVPPCQFNDGDIVATDSGRWLGIIKNKYDFEYYTVHCAIDYAFNDIFYRCGEYRFSRLATEEEKETLFQAIKDNGYRWNPETKTLDKLVEPKFKVGDRIKLNNCSSIYTITDLLEDKYRATIHSYDLYEIKFERQDAYQLVPNKFDINTLVPFESRVLVRGSDPLSEWKPAIFGIYRGDKHYSFYVVGGNCWKQCIPYEGNEHLLGTTDDCDEYFKTWK